MSVTKVVRSFKDDYFYLILDRRLNFVKHHFQMAFTG
jgi:hypothetical protein